jgi:ankyrin repeat protein
MKHLFMLLTISIITIFNSSQCFASERSKIFDYISGDCSYGLVEYINAHPADVNARDDLSNYGRTPLMVAAHYNMIKCIEILGAHGADPNLKDTYNTTALNYTSDIPTMEALIKVGAEMKFASTYMVANAISKRNVELLKFIAKQGVDVKNYNNEDGNTLSLIIEDFNCTFNHKSLEVLNYLIELGVDPNGQDSNNQGKTPLIVAANCGWRKVDMSLAIEVLVKAGANISATDIKGEGVLSKAVRSPGMIKTFLKLGADVEQKDNRGATVYCHAGTDPWAPDETIEILLPYLKNINQTCPSNYSRIMPAQFSYGTGTNLPLTSILLVNNKSKFMFELLNRGANIDAVSEENQSLIMIATALQKKEIIKELFKYNPNLNIRGNDYRGLNVLELAAYTFDEDLVLDFIALNINLHGRAGFNKTSLIILAEVGMHQAGLELIKQGVDINATDEWGSTPLLAAVYHDFWCHPGLSLELVKALVNAGANVNARNNEGETALKKAEREDIREYLRSVGGIL